MTTLNELIGEFTAEELQVYVDMEIPLELVGVLTPEEERELEEMDREDHEEWLREQEFNAAVDAIDPCWSMNDYSNLIAEHMIDDLDDEE